MDACFVAIDETDVVYARSSLLFSWTQQTINLTPYVGTTHTLSFQFFSDSSLTAEGWYLDDIVVTGVGSATAPQLTGPGWSQGTFTVSLSTQTAGLIGIGSLWPDPVAPTPNRAGTSALRVFGGSVASVVVRVITDGIEQEGTAVIQTVAQRLAVH